MITLDFEAYLGKNGTVLWPKYFTKEKCRLVCGQNYCHLQHLPTLFSNDSISVLIQDFEAYLYLGNNNVTGFEVNIFYKGEM